MVIDSLRSLTGQKSSLKIKTVVAYAVHLVNTDHTTCEEMFQQSYDSFNDYITVVLQSNLNGFINNLVVEMWNI